MMHGDHDGAIAARLRTKRVRDPVEPSDGRRILITRLWPRGMTKERVAAEWIQALAPSRELLFDYRDGRVTWAQYSRRFLTEMESPEAVAALARIGDLLGSDETVTLLCECQAGRDGENRILCHRRLVKKLVLGSGN